MIEDALIQLIDAQEEIIRLQSEAIHELTMTLAQHLCAEELDSMPVIEKINMAAQLRVENSL